ncbi:hypothetical protein KKE26_09610 [bacterium]|nr:hypothetical protein [bacterium]MBU1753206.1 hypothetical protein [bacterium]
MIAKNIQSNSNILDSLERFIETRQENFDKECQYLELSIRDMAVEFKQQFPKAISLSITGSYLHPEFFSPISDVDFVVAGLQTKEYFDAFLFIEERLDREIHLIREEEIPANLRERFQKERRVLYEKYIVGADLCVCPDICPDNQGTRGRIQDREQRGNLTRRRGERGGER